MVDARILIMGLSFKENCTDLRNTKVVDIIDTLNTYHVKVDIHDPWIDPDLAKAEYNISMLKQPGENQYDAIILAVAHEKFRELGIDQIRKFGKTNSIIFDIKYLFPRGENRYRL